MDKIYAARTLPASFLGFLLFQMSLAILLGLLMFAVFAIAESLSGREAAAQLDSIFIAIAAYCLLALAVLLVSPLWGKKIIGAFTDSNPGYLQIAILGVWIPLLLSILCSAIVGSLFSDSTLSTMLIFGSQIAVVVAVSFVYINYQKSA